jgi:CSLREA domain-containing protein
VVQPETVIGKNMVKTRNLFFTLILVIFISVIFAHETSAATYVVTKIADTDDGVCDADCSLREAVAQSNASSNSDVINFDAAVFSTPQTIVLVNGQITIALSDTTTINGPGANLLTISGNNQNRIFFSNWGTFLNISNMTLTQGFALYGGAAALSNMTTLSNMIITGNVAEGDGIQNGIYAGSGGGLYVNGSTTIMNSVISNNLARGNLKGSGGGIYSNGSGNVIANCTFTGNTARGKNAQDETLNQGGEAFGGALNGGFTVFNSTFAGNKAIAGNGGRLSDGRNGNGGVAWGGAIYSSGARILNSTLSDNSVVSGNGGNITGNGGIAQGGGIYDFTLEIANTTIVNNTVTAGSGVIGGNAQGGGIYGGDFQSKVINSTITGNNVTRGAGIQTNGLAQGGGMFSRPETNQASAFRNNIVAENTALNGMDVFGTFVNATNNLIGIGEPSTGITNGVNGNLVGTVDSPVNPGLAPLANNGGFTETRALLETSPAIDAGNKTFAINPLTTQILQYDQRGLQRIFPTAGQVDIGAYEFGAASVVATGAPDLQNASDTGSSNTDNITRAATASFVVPNVMFGATVELLRDGAVVASGTANNTFGTVFLTDSNPPRDAAVVYTARQSVPGAVSPTSAPLTVTFDNTAPALTINQAVSQADPARLQPVVFTAVFSEPVAGFFPSHVSLAGSTANVSTAIISTTFQTSTVYSVEIRNVTANSLKIIASVPASVLIDPAGNFNLASTSTDNSVTLDNVAPTASVNQAPEQADPASQEPLQFSVAFSESVAGFEASDLSLAGSTANVSFAQISVTGSGANYLVSIRNITSRGQVRVSLPAGRVTDSVGNVNTASTSSDNIITYIFKPKVFDFDGDGKTDIGIFRPSDGSWWYGRSSADDFRVYAFGAGTDIIAPGDFTGDGAADLGIFRPSTGEWFVQRSEDNSFFSFPFGTSEDIPAPADYDADGKTDAAVFRPSSGTWFILNSSGSGTSIVQFGTAEDKPVPADFDGDGKADIAIFRPSDGSWWYLQSSNAQFKVYRFGVGTDKPVPGDYTGDGKADIAVWRPSTGEWFFQRSEDNSYFSVPFGQSGDVPAPGDYDGDGKFDTAVFRPLTSNWFVQRSTAGILITTFGASGDRPIPNAFVR